MRPIGSQPRPDRPLRLAIEQHVHCPRAGLVPVERCYGCELLQGTLMGDMPQILCAWSEEHPALHRVRVAVGPGRAEPAERHRAALVFETDWPDE